MKRKLCRWIAGLLTVGLLIAAIPVSAADLRYEYPANGEDTIQSPSAVLLYMGVKPEQDVYLYEKDADTPYQPGSLMRVAMIGYAMEIIREKNLDMDTVTGTYTLELFNHYVAGTGLHVALMNFGETWTLRDLLTVCGIQTAADCAVTLATALSGSPEAFTEGLNAYAQRLGCTRSKFTNVMGLNDGVQCMTARETAIFASHALQDSDLRRILELDSWKVAPVEGGKTRSWPTSFEMIRPSAAEAFYSKAEGGKTGSSDTEMNLMAYGGDNGYSYMAVVMGAPRKTENGEMTNIAYADARRLIRWGILGFRYETIARKNEPVARVPVEDCSERSDLSLVPTQDLTAVLGSEILTESLTRRVITTQEQYVAPIEQGAILGRLEVYSGDKLVATVPLAAATAAPRNALYALWCDVGAWFSSGWFVGLLIVLILLIGGYAAYLVLYNRRKRGTRKSK